MTDRLRRPWRRWFAYVVTPGRVLEILRARKHFVDWQKLALTYAGVRRFHTGESFSFRGFDGGRLRVWERSDLLNLWAIFCAREYWVEPSDTQIVDLGANVGMFTLYAAVCAPNARIRAYEPVQATFARLNWNVQSSRLGQGRIGCKRAGIARADGVREISVGQGSDVATFYLSAIRGGAIEKPSKW